MDNLIIENMNISHLDSIKNILEIDFDDFWNYNILKNEIENKNSKYIVAKIDNEIVGFAGIVITLDTAELNNIVIKKSFRGHGFSSILLKHIIDLAKTDNCAKINLEVRCDNFVAISLYKKFEFIQVGSRKNYYKNKDGLLFTKFL